MKGFEKKKAGVAVGLVMELDGRNSILRITVVGPLTDQILWDGYATVAKYFRANPPCRTILDLSQVTKFEVSSGAIVRLASTAPALPPGPPRVFVAPSDFVFGMARMFQILGEKTRPDLQVVRKLDEAYRVIGVESPEFAPVRM